MTLRLLHVTVENFHCILEARVDFDRGINVLHGPNDLGKSSLVHAIRAALLLPTGSTASQLLTSWGLDATPHVQLTFEVGEQQIYRVTKNFGTGRGASAALEFSKDGKAFSPDSQGRQVDDRIRGLLQWGLDKPGGRGGKKGLPISFLTQVFLPAQSDVSGLFDQNLAEDADTTGRERIVAALGALAQDPVVKGILAHAQDKVDEAFTGTGRKKRGAGSPFKQATERVTDIQKELSHWEQVQLDSETETEKIRALSDDKDECARREQDSAARLKQLQDDKQASDAYRAASDALQSAQDVRAGLDAQRTALEDRQAEAEALQAQTATQRHLLDEAQAKLKHCNEATVAAADALRRAQSEESEAERAHQQAQLRQRTAELELEKAESQELERRARAGLEATAAAADSAANVERARVALSEQQVGSAELEAQQSDHRAHQEHLVCCQHLARHRAAEGQLTAATQAQAEVDKLRGDATTLDGEAAALRDDLAKLKLPEEARLAEAAELAQQLEVARAALGGGLSVELERTGDAAIEVGTDGNAPVSAPPGSSTLEADRSIEIAIANVGNLRVTAGDPATRKRAQDLETRWTNEVVPLLKASGVSSLDQLKSRRDAARSMRDKLEGLSRDAKYKRDQADAQADRYPPLEQLQSTLDERGTRLSGEPTDAQQALVDKLGDKWESALGEELDAVEASIDTAGKLLNDKRASLATAQATLAQLEGEDKALAAQARAATAELALPPEEALASATQTLDRVVTELAANQDKADQLEEAAGQQVALAEQALSAAREAETEAEAALQEAKSAFNEIHSREMQLVGALQQQRQTVDELDFDGAAGKVEVAIASRDALTAPAQLVTADDIEAAVARHGQDVQTVADVRDQIRSTEGALTKVGGDVARERVEELREALARAQRAQEETELDYDAWQLLLNTVREAENTEGAHLGRALGAPIAERFAAITQGRYGSLQLDPDLASGGLSIGGEMRSPDALSVGTQDQLATIFRLALATQLGTAIVLDDQLVQTDAARMGHLRAELRTAADQIQVIAVTCRPEDYLNPLSGPAPHTVDLGQAITRHPTVVTRAPSVSPPSERATEEPDPRASARRTPDGQ